MKRPYEQVTVTMYHPTLDVTNEDRALMVRDLVEAFMDSYGCDNMEQAIGDLIADLGHLFDRLDPDERESLDDLPSMIDGTGMRRAAFDTFVIHRALYHYHEEVAEETFDDEEDE
jgi:hypothetical protein